MSQFVFAVTETRNYEMEYVVEADTAAEAQEKAEIGDTISETELSLTGVSDRYVAEQLPVMVSAVQAEPAGGDDASGRYLVPYPLRVFFDCSTAHLSPSTCDYLATAAARSKASPLTWTAETPFGWFVWAEETPGEDVPADLAAIMRHARAQGAEYLLFDSDAAESADFPILRQD